MSMQVIVSILWSRSTLCKAKRLPVLANTVGMMVCHRFALRSSSTCVHLWPCYVDYLSVRYVYTRQRQSVKVLTIALRIFCSALQ